MPENWDECILLFRVMKCTKTSLKMQGESWKHPWQLPCNAKDCVPKLAFGKPVFQKQEKPKHLKQGQAPVVLLKHMNPQNKEQWRKEFMKNTLQGKDSISYCITIQCLNSFRCPKQCGFQMQRQQWTRNGRRSQKHTKQRKGKSTLLHWWTSASSKSTSTSRWMYGRQSQVWKQICAWWTTSLIFFYSFDDFLATELVQSLSKWLAIDINEKLQERIQIISLYQYHHWVL